MGSVVRFDRELSRREVRRVRMLVAQRKRQTPAKLWQGDCLELMRNIPDASIPMVLADLPFGLTRYRWDRMIPLEQLWAEYRRIITPTGAIVLFGMQPFTTMLAAPALDLLKFSMVWDKARITDFPLAWVRPLRAHEDVLVFSPGATVHAHRSKRRMTYHPQGLVELPRPRRRGRNTPAHTGDYTFEAYEQRYTKFPQTILRFPADGDGLKPVELMRYLIRTFSNPGETVLDNTMGAACPTGVAALMEGRRFIGIEADPERYDLARQRIADAERQAA